MFNILRNKYTKENAYELLKNKESFPDNIGKTARNELRKYAATWSNNVSIALVAAGILLPMIGILPRVLKGMRDDYNAGQMLSLEIPPDLTALLLVTTITFLFALRFRRLANRALITLED